MQFNKDDENYIYGVIGKNVKKYRKEKKLTQAQLAEKIDYSLSFVAGIESKKHQTFSLGALWRISLILGIDMYKLCIDEELENKKSHYKTYYCNNCGYHTEIPDELLKIVHDASILTNNQKPNLPSFKCPKCNQEINPKKE